MNRRRAPAGALALALAACDTPGETADTLAEDAAPPADETVAAAADLVGLSQTAVRVRLGAPDRRRPEGEVAIWRYDSDRCVVDVFFYPDGDARTVRFAEARDRIGAPADEPACFADLRARGGLTS